MVAIPLHNDRLNFNLPDFTRLSWVSEQAYETWEPRRNLISKAWSAIEWLSVISGIRSCCLISVSPEAYSILGSRLAKNGLSVKRLGVQGVGHGLYCSSPSPIEHGKPVIYRTVAGDPESIMEFEKAWSAGNHNVMGTLLGYPACCRDFFIQVWVDQKQVDTTWNMADNSNKLLQKEGVVELEGSPQANILWRWMGIRPVPHLPCSFNCLQTIEFSKQLFAIGKDFGFADEMEWLYEILSWPVEWSALHGIAVIKTPVLRVSTRTTATFSEHIVQWKGIAYPSEGAYGIHFPYRTSRKLKIAGSSCFRRGFDNSIQSDSDQTDWYYGDNGFSSCHQMHLLHNPIVTLGCQELINQKGNIIDIGCGNGALLKKICERNKFLIAYGIDINGICVQHARLLLPKFKENFIEGNLFDPASWLSLPSRYNLAILMIGRLLEVPRNIADNFLIHIKKCCKLMLVYVYPDYSHHDFNYLVQSAGLVLEKRTGDLTGLVSFDKSI